MTQLVKIGNSKGVRIPKPLIKQARLDDVELEFSVTGQGLLITPKRAPRVGWKEEIERIIAKRGEESIDDEWMDPALESDEALEW